MCPLATAQSTHRKGTEILPLLFGEHDYVLVILIVVSYRSVIGLHALITLVREIFPYGS